jgi:hypothetical protein
MKTMIPTRMRYAAWVLALNLLLGGAVVYQAGAMAPLERSEPQAGDAKNSAAGLSADRFDKLRALIKSKLGGFDDIAWMTDLWEARKKAADEGKPLDEC